MRNSLKGVVSRVNRIANKAGRGSSEAEIYAERRRILEEGRRRAAAGLVRPTTSDENRARGRELWARREALR